MKNRVVSAFQYIVVVSAWMLPCARVSSMDAGGEWRRHFEHLDQVERIGARHEAVSEELARRTNFSCGDCRRIHDGFDAELKEIFESSTASMDSSDPDSAERSLEKYLNDWDALCAKYEKVMQSAPGDTLCGNCRESAPPAGTDQK